MIAERISLEETAMKRKAMLRSYLPCQIGTSDIQSAEHFPIRCSTHQKYWHENVARIVVAYA
jgi:hypothetical protein